jgi:hypothetical protein
MYVCVAAASVLLASVDAGIAKTPLTIATGTASGTVSMA